MRRFCASLWLMAGLLGFGCSSETPPPDPESGDTGPLWVVDAGASDAEPASPLPSHPALLSETGLYANEVGGALSANVREYGIRFPLFTDGLEKRRFLLLPEGGSIDTSNEDHWSFPEGTRIFKEFSLDGRPLETRLLWKTGPTSRDWIAVSYRYRPDGTDAEAVPNGEDNVLGTFHNVPSQSECQNCHQGGGDFVLGIGAFQLPQIEFDRWIEEGLLPRTTLFRSPPGTPTEQAALGYLHGNCGHCHGALHPLSALRTLRLRLLTSTTEASQAPAWQTSVNAPANHETAGTTLNLVPGQPQASQLYVRMTFRDEVAMPPLGTEYIDESGMAIIEQWIRESAE